MNTTLDFSYIPNLITYSSGIALQSCLIISYLTLPFYCYVHNLRRHKEKNLHIVQSFYKIVKLSYFVFTFFVVTSIMFMTVFKTILQPDRNPTSQLVFDSIALPICLLGYSLHILQQTFHLLLFSLAIMSFLKYHFPYDFLYSQNYISNYVRKLNVFFVLKDFICFAIYFLNFGKQLGDEIMNITLSVYLVLYIIVNVIICFLTPFIYIPIIIGMKKHRHLHSQQHIYIHEYMFIQSIMVLLFKIVTAPFWVESFNSDLSFALPLIMSITDVITTPWLIQLSYLRCNLTELYTLYISFDFWKFLKIVFGGMDAAVHPVLRPIAFSIT
ncbi:Serpentine Receptor, class Z [Caenorhabditis elegans]|uniref:Serpentine Receptor, class Z n=1 Tax=Caenorhabditis elegans TaxID=6239 RepID=Q9XX65_CAEEL|nr:Serpentine Receptor, class Z [Caenorhabditis elegans]CAA20970.1 Serpentine Receptor, class Z [Caenorhabditis elegans]|eukprot:NP_507299.1 Serpentine Receptor, class Z [Caenorhabditis elegans]